MVTRARALGSKPLALVTLGRAIPWSAGERTGESSKGGWIAIDRDLLPLMREALTTAWAKGFLSGSREPGDYYIGGMNLGWELTGTFDVELEIRNLSLKLLGN